jgi:hypothetical protein
MSTCCIPSTAESHSLREVLVQMSEHLWMGWVLVGSRLLYPGRCVCVLVCLCVIQSRVGFFAMQVELRKLFEVLVSSNTIFIPVCPQVFSV